MVGQKNLLSRLTKWEVEKIPHFIVITGFKGSGKFTVAKLISDKLQANFSVCGIKVDEIREVINTAYNVREKVVYCIKDADTMRAEAKNALLKITEEPPESAYFILTVSDASTLLDTIKSRATVLDMEPYSPDDLMEYCNLRGYTENVTDICDIAGTPYEVDLLVDYGQDFLDSVELVIDNIIDVQLGNAFKSANKLAIKNEEGYDLRVFWEAVVNVCLNKIHEPTMRYANMAIVTIPYTLKVTKLGVNKQQLYDAWVFEIRGIV